MKINLKKDLKTFDKDAKMNSKINYKINYKIITIILILLAALTTPMTSLAEDTQDGESVVTITKTIINTTSNTASETEKSNIIPTKALNPIEEVKSNYTSTITYRLQPKTIRMVDCRQVCPIDCNRTQLYEANIEESALVTNKYYLNYTSDKAMNFFATTHPAFEKCAFSYPTSQYNPFEFNVESHDKLTIYYKNKTAVLSFANTTLEGTNIEISSEQRSLYLPLNQTVRGNLLDNNDDLEFTITNLVENEEKYRKNTLRGYRFDLSIKRTAYEPMVEPEIIIENKTVVEEAKLPGEKTGNLLIAARSSIKRPISFITGSIIAATIILVSLGLYAGYKKMYF